MQYKALKSYFNLDVNILWLLASPVLAMRTQPDNHGNQYKLYIVAKSMRTFKAIVLPYYSSSFLYKLN
jgi:hypothetical protein